MATVGKLNTNISCQLREDIDKICINTIFSSQVEDAANHAYLAKTNTNDFDQQSLIHNKMHLMTAVYNDEAHYTHNFSLIPQTTAMVLPWSCMAYPNTSITIDDEGEYWLVQCMVDMVTDETRIQLFQWHGTRLVLRLSKSIICINQSLIKNILPQVWFGFCLQAHILHLKVKLHRFKLLVCISDSHWRSNHTL